MSTGWGALGILLAIVAGAVIGLGLFYVTDSLWLCLAGWALPVAGALSLAQRQANRKAGLLTEREQRDRALARYARDRTAYRPED